MKSKKTYRIVRAGLIIWNVIIFCAALYLMYVLLDHFIDILPKLANAISDEWSKS